MCWRQRLGARRGQPLQASELRSRVTAQPWVWVCTLGGQEQQEQGLGHDTRPQLQRPCREASGLQLHGTHAQASGSCPVWAAPGPSGGTEGTPEISQLQLPPWVGGLLPHEPVSSWPTSRNGLPPLPRAVKAPAWSPHCWLWPPLRSHLPAECPPPQAAIRSWLPPSRSCRPWLSWSPPRSAERVCPAPADNEAHGLRKLHSFRWRGCSPGDRGRSALSPIAKLLAAAAPGRVASASPLPSPSHHRPLTQPRAHAGPPPPAHTGSGEPAERQHTLQAASSSFSRVSRGETPEELRRQALLVGGCGRGGCEPSLEQSQGKGSALLPQHQPQGSQRAQPPPEHSCPVPVPTGSSAPAARRRPQGAPACCHGPRKVEQVCAGARAGLCQPRLNHALLGPVTWAHWSQVTSSRAFPIRVVGQEEGGL